MYFSTGLMYVPKDANLRGLVVAERAVATKCKENEAKCATIKLLFKLAFHMLSPFYFKHFFLSWRTSVA